MDSALGWLGSIIEWFGQLIPRIILVPTTHSGVKFVYGNKIKVMSPGLYLYWPLVTQYTLYPIVRQTNNLDSQVLMTRDGKSIIISAIIVFHVQNIEKALVKSWSVDDTINDVAQTAIVSIITSRTLEEIRTEIDNKIKIELTESVRRNLVPFGIKVETCALTDFSTCFTVRKFTNKNTPLIQDDE